VYVCKGCCTGGQGQGHCMHLVFGSCQVSVQGMKGQYDHKSERPPG
jgi:hypothetical protein